MMTEVSNEEIADLAQVYDTLKQDAKLLVGDLVEGIKMWAFASFLLFVVGLLGFALFVVDLNPGSVISDATYRLIAISGALTLSIVGVLSAVYFMWRFRRLRIRYQALFEASKRLR